MSSSKSGIRGSLENVKRSTEAENKAMRDSGRFQLINKTTEDMLLIASSQLAGLKRGHGTMGG